MKTSDTITDIAQALCKFQSEVKDAYKGAQGHNYRYADLGTILQLVRPLMGKHGLSVVQMPTGDTLNMGVSTRLMHMSGEWLEDTLYMGVTASRGMSEAQAAGSVITYMRRYALAAALGITQTDDDAAVKEPEIVPATETQLAQIQDYIDAGEISPRRASWIKNHGDNMTEKQAATIIKETKESERVKKAAENG